MAGGVAHGRFVFFKRGHLPEALLRRRPTHHGHLVKRVFFLMSPLQPCIASNIAPIDEQPGKQEAVLSEEKHE